MSYSFDIPETAIDNLLRLLAVSPNRGQSEEIIGQFEKAYPKEFPVEKLKITASLTEKLHTAQNRLKELQLSHVKLIQKIERIFMQALQLEPSVAANLKKILKKHPIQASHLDEWLQMMRIPDCEPILLSDLEILIGSSWFGVYEHNNDSFPLKPVETLNTVCSYVVVKQLSKLAPLHPGWVLLADACYSIAKRIKQSSEGIPLKGPSRLDLEEMQIGETLLFPIGLANYKTTSLHLIIIDRTETNYRLKLLVSDYEPILALGPKEDTICPEVIWENPPLSILCSDEFWKPLFEAGTLKLEETEQVVFNRDGIDHLTISPDYLIPYITRKIGFSPISWNIDLGEQAWQEKLTDRYSNKKWEVRDFEEYQKRPTGQTGPIIIKPTDKYIHPENRLGTFHKFIQLIAMEMLPNRNEYKFFKAETSLLILTGAFLSLQNRLIPPLHRGTFMRLMELGISKITAPLEELLMNQPTHEQIETSKVLFATLAELKHRYGLFKIHTDKITITAPRASYPSVHKSMKIDLKQLVSTMPVVDTMKAVVLKQRTSAFPICDVWNVQELGKLHAFFEEWYQILLDAKYKCEPVALITMAHRNIFSKLPIPKTGRLEDLFPEPLSEGLLVGTLIMLNKICSLVVSAAYEETFIPPQLVADISRAYRFAFELFRRFNPEVESLPVSWHALNVYLNSRHSFHAAGDCRETLEELALSFRAISPKGDLPTSEDNKDINLFYHSWKTFPSNKGYKLIRQKLTDSYERKSVDEIITLAQLADAIGLKTEETQGKSGKWETSFAGQALSAMEQISQFHAVTIYSTAKAVKEAQKTSQYEKYYLLEHLGPEDHFRISPSGAWKGLGEFINHLGGPFSYVTEVENAKTSLSQRMVHIQDESMNKTLEELRGLLVNQSRTQAELLKKLPIRGASQRVYFLNQMASGHAILNTEVLLEYFETRSSLLLNRDYRAYFSGIIVSAHIFSEQVGKEKTLLMRFSQFMQRMIDEDERLFQESKLHLERLLWISDRLREAYKIEPSELIGRQLKQVLDILIANQESQISSAPFLLCINHSLGGKALSILDLARLHMLVGRYPPIDLNYYHTWMEACDAMQERGHEINEVLRNGPLELRKEIWKLILKSEDQVDLVASRPASELDFATLAKVQQQLSKLSFEFAYYHRWFHEFTESSHRSSTWKENAIKKEYEKGVGQLKDLDKEYQTSSKELTNVAETALCFNDASVLCRADKKWIYVNWEFGIVLDDQKRQTIGVRLPTYIRQDKYLESLGSLLKEEVKESIDGEFIFEKEPYLSISIANHEAIYNYGSQKFRLVSKREGIKWTLPASMQEGFTIWLAIEDSSSIRGLIMAHKEDGVPTPMFYIGSDDRIYTIKGNGKLTLADQAFYPEAEIFSRWGLSQDKLLIWINEENHVKEIFVPIRFADQPFSRMIRSEEGKWRIDGTDLHLSTKEYAVPSFAGHPVYLTAKDSQNREFLLLGKAPEFEYNWRTKNSISWNQVIASGAEEVMRVYRILPNGQIEGLIRP